MDEYGCATREEFELVRAYAKKIGCTDIYDLLSMAQLERNLPSQDIFLEMIRDCKSLTSLIQMTGHSGDFEENTQDYLEERLGEYEVSFGCASDYLEEEQVLERIQTIRETHHAAFKVLIRFAERSFVTRSSSNYQMKDGKKLATKRIELHFEGKVHTMKIWWDATEPFKVQIMLLRSWRRQDIEPIQNITHYPITIEFDENGHLNTNKPINVITYQVTCSEEQIKALQKDLAGVLGKAFMDNVEIKIQNIMIKGFTND